MTDPLPSVRPSSEARERAVEILSRLFVEDTIGDDELEARLQRVYAATTGAELDAVLSDLPVEETRIAQRPSAPPPAQSASARVSATFSSQERRLAGVLPREMALGAHFGSIELDLTGATVQEGTTTIHVRAIFGNIEVALPAGVAVVGDGNALLGNFAVSGGAPHADAARVIHVTGRAVLGNVECIAPEPTGGRLPAGGETA